MPAQGRLILITGATGAIGGELARRYAAAGTELVLHGRRLEVLEALAQECQAKGASVRLSQVALDDDPARGAWLDALPRAPDLVLLCAGMNHGVTHACDGEDGVQARALLELNLRIPIDMARHLAPTMQARGSGQLVFISSLAAWFGLPVTPTYSASKAGIKAYGEALRGLLAADGVGVTVVMPGYVESSMARAMPGPKPFLVGPERAAKRIQAGVAANRARVSFPWPLALGTQCLALLPPCLSERLVRWSGYGVGRLCYGFLCC